MRKNALWLFLSLPLVLALGCIKLSTPPAPVPAPPPPPAQLQMTTDCMDGTPANRVPLTIIADPAKVDTQPKSQRIDRDAREGAHWNVTGKGGDIEWVEIEFVHPNIAKVICSKNSSTSLQCDSGTFCPSSQPDHREKYNVRVKFTNLKDPVVEDPDMVIFP